MAGSVELRLTGGSTNNGPALSLGGVMSSVVVAATSINNLFDNVNQDEAQIGSTDYRAIDITNTSTDMEILTPTVYLNPNVNSSSVKIYMGIESTGNPHVSTWTGVLTTAENVAPSGISFAEYPSSAPLSISDIPVGESQRLWFKRVVAANTFKKCPTAFTMNLDGEYGLSFMTVLSVDPVDEETGVVLNKTLSAIFNSNLNSSSISGNIELTVNGSSIPFSATAAGSTLTIDPTSNLPADETIVCTLTTNILSSNGRRLNNSYVWNFETLSLFYLFFTCDGLQPTTADYAPDTTFEYASTSTAVLNSDYRLYGTGCLQLGKGEYLDITSTSLDDVVKNLALNFYAASPSTATPTYTVIDFLNSSGGSIVDLKYTPVTGTLLLGAADVSGTYASNQYHFVNLIATTDGNYTIKINGSETTLTTSISVPTGVSKIRIGQSATDGNNIYIDNILSGK